MMRCHIPIEELRALQGTVPVRVEVRQEELA